MRHITKNFSSPPADLLPNTGAVTSLNEMLAEGGHTRYQKDATGNFIRNKRGGKIKDDELLDDNFDWKSTKDDLKVLYNNKCAYCEAVEHDPQIEHYRPKKKVTKEPNHPGYYWLAYEWSNLVPSCYDCNKASGSKGNQFPIRGTRVSAPPETAYSNRDLYKADQPPLIDEQPYLLHPEIDRPEAFLKICSDGTLKGTDRDDRGEKTIKICKLTRGNLLHACKSLIDGWSKRINEALDRLATALLTQEQVFAQTQFHTDLERVFSDIREAANVSQSYSFVAWYVYRDISHFRDIISRQLPASDRPIVEQAFAAYIAANPV